jgi:hypothetical protein
MGAISSRSALYYSLVQYVTRPLATTYTGAFGKYDFMYASTCEGPIRRTREGGSEWEPIKILFKNPAYEPNFTRVPLQASLAKSTQPLECNWT